jgi:hypothetical protein
MINSALNESTVRFRMLVDVYSLSTGTTRACNGTKFLLAAGNTYSPVGHLGGIEKIEEDTDVFPRALRMWFSAVNTARIADVLNEQMFNKPVTLSWACLDPYSLTLVASAEALFKGRINTCELKLADKERGNFFEIEAESRLARAPHAQYFNRETLWSVYGASGDTFFDYMTQIPLAKANWGGIPVGGRGTTPPKHGDDRHDPQPGNYTD